jgi:curli biogenesis system outer membrane secretion channel CsgG
VRRIGTWVIPAVTVLALAGTGERPAAQSTRPTVAVLAFDYGSLQRWWGDATDVGVGVADLLVDELVNDGSYRVIERKRLDAVLAEQNFSNSERADPSAQSVAQIGKALGVKYLIVGSITQFGTEKSQRNVGGGGFGVGGFGVGRVGTSKGKAKVAIATRVIDTTTGEILASAKGEGTSSRSGLLLGGAGYGGVGAHGDIQFGSSDFRETILGEATDTAVKDVAKKLVGAKTRLTS